MFKNRMFLLLVLIVDVICMLAIIYYLMGRSNVNNNKQLGFEMHESVSNKHLLHSKYILDFGKFDNEFNVNICLI